MQEKILVIGCKGQFGSELTSSLQKIYGNENIIASDIIPNPYFNGIFENLDANDSNQLYEVVNKYHINQIYHLAAILSANGEKNPICTWNTNMSTLINVLEIARSCNIEKVFFPSSIAVYGSLAQKNETPQSSILNPSTIYGISKAAGENWIQYYRLKYNLDVRSIRFPGIISYKSMPGGGTTDYAVDIFHKAILNEEFVCYLQEDTALPMVYITDAIRATIELMDAPKSNIKSLSSYNISGVSFTPKDAFDSIKSIIPDFKITYKPDYRQEIANNWPRSLNDSEAQLEWKWKPSVDLQEITTLMLSNIAKKYNKINVFY